MSKTKTKRIPVFASVEIRYYRCVGTGRIHKALINGNKSYFVFECADGPYALIEIVLLSDNENDMCEACN